MMQRRWANLALAIALLLFLGTLWFRHYLLAQYVETMALAGLAGGIADWYAVTALFRHPLGQKWLPHTSIISANRDRIIEAIATMVEQELLSVTFIEANIEKLNITFHRFDPCPELLVIAQRHHDSHQRQFKLVQGLIRY